MKQRNLMVLVGLGALAALAVGASNASAAPLPDTGDGDGDGDGDKDLGSDDFDLPPPAPQPSTSVGDPPNSGATGMLDNYFGSSDGIARALYLLDSGMPGWQTMSSQLLAQAKDTDSDDKLPFVLRFQRAYNKLAAAGRAGKSLAVFGKIPGDLGALQLDSTMGYKTLAAIYATIQYFSPTAAALTLNKRRVQGKVAIPANERSNLTATVDAL